MVVSFTEATASEIKAKIIERLISALKIIESINTNVKPYEIDDVLNEWVELNITSKEKSLYILTTNHKQPDLLTEEEITKLKI